MMKRKIAVLTGSRAEYGILRPLLKLIDDRKDMELILLVTGLHLLKDYGYTIDRIKKDGFPINSVVEMYDETERKEIYYGSALARGIRGFTKELSKTRPDMLIVVGDRLEPLAATLAAATLKIPIAHIHGGDATDSGHIDESIRHSITRFANIHFPSTEQHHERLRKMGEEHWRIFNVGSMGLDTIVKKKRIFRDELSRRIDFEVDDKTVVSIFHPVHLEKDMGNQMREIVEAILELNLRAILLYPNNDLGNEEIIKEIEKARKFDFIKILKSLSHDDYIDLIKNVAVMVGNSSSGIIEAASVKLPVINVGSRNKGRGTALNITYVDAKREQIVAAIERALFDEAFREKMEKVRNPFGDGKTAERIIQVIGATKFDDKLMRKRITY
jgi:UDP-hydrolysing UDP-N-acetyl-D-glucosamine 2-epimerase